MKILVWNLLNIGRTKLPKTLSPPVQLAQMGNNVLDYIVKVAMADVVWSNPGGIMNPSPVDIFMLIELKSGGTAKGAPVSGAALPVLTSITNAMNIVAAALPLASPFYNQYSYNFATPKLTGRHECVGLIYNTKSLNFTDDGSHSGVLLNNVNTHYLVPRTPWWAQLTEKASGSIINMVGIHAPPPSGSENRFKAPVKFSNLLQYINTVNQTLNTPKQPVCIAGDFNCDQSNTYKAMGGPVSSFTGLTGYGYTVAIPAGTASSIRRAIDNSYMKPENYLSGSYDNIVINFASAMVAKVLDLIGEAPIYGSNMVAVFNSTRRVSDHLPVLLQ